MKHTHDTDTHIHTLWEKGWLGRGWGSGKGQRRALALSFVRMYMSFYLPAMLLMKRSAFGHWFMRPTWKLPRGPLLRRKQFPQTVPSETSRVGSLFLSWVLNHCLLSLNFIFCFLPYKIQEDFKHSWIKWATFMQCVCVYKFKNSCE